MQRYPPRQQISVRQFHYFLIPKLIVSVELVEPGLGLDSTSVAAALARLDYIRSPVSWQFKAPGVVLTNQTAANYYSVRHPYVQVQWLFGLLVNRELYVNFMSNCISLTG